VNAASDITVLRLIKFRQVFIGIYWQLVQC